MMLQLDTNIKDSKIIDTKASDFGICVEWRLPGSVKHM